KCEAGHHSVIFDVSASLFLYKSVLDLRIARRTPFLNPSLFYAPNRPNIANHLVSTFGPVTQLVIYHFPVHCFNGISADQLIILLDAWTRTLTHVKIFFLDKLND